MRTTSTYFNLSADDNVYVEPVALVIEVQLEEAGTAVDALVIWNLQRYHWALVPFVALPSQTGVLYKSVEPTLNVPDFRDSLMLVLIVGLTTVGLRVTVTE